MKSREIGIRAIAALVGVGILALGAALLRLGQVGLDPFTAANIGIAAKLNLSLGIYQLLINLVILLFVFFLDRKYIGLGTIINMVLTGFLIDFFTEVLGKIISPTPTVVLKIVLLIAGVLIFTFGASFYMAAALGNAPYDAIAPIIVDRTQAKYRIVRVTQDIVFVLLGLLFAGPVGIGTVINAFFTGPLITFWNERVSRPLVQWLTKV